MRLRKTKNALEKLHTFSQLVVQEPFQQKGNWHGVFGNEYPIFLEVGMGKGQFLLKHAQTNLQINYLGIERSDSVLLKAAKKVDQAGLGNIKLMNVDAIVLDQVFALGEIDQIYLNFSDPWPKARHAKRRLTSPGFLNLYKELLKRHGIIEMKTDNRKLFEYSIIQFQQAGFEFLELSLDLHAPSEEEQKTIITTEYEDKFQELGQMIYYIKVRV
jgi:tRNA (guanine-N7-)-methyltransferase